MPEQEFVKESAAANESVFRWKEADAYLFDIDGTLLLSPDRTHRYALHRAMLDVFGVETTIDGIPYTEKPIREFCAWRCSGSVFRTRQSTRR